MIKKNYKKLWNKEFCLLIGISPFFFYLFVNYNFFSKELKSSSKE
ncbi:hypothetical protein HMPREF1552_01234 [Leptotrichia sp. oral taxon 879 str. F0557]|nr:hypothetical protein HMPREF1552_01234 [Leptotrichia sp. oral taxon 879 str. F0557]